MTTISASSTIGIYLASPSVTNPVAIDTGVTISSNGNALYGFYGVWTIANSGSIASVLGNAIYLGAGGLITNAASASIIGVDGVNISGGTGTVVNDGSIAGNATSSIGVLLAAGGSVANQSGATISGYAGVDLTSGGTVTNAASASITGVYDGVGISGSAGTVVNHGNIAGTGIGGIGALLGSGGAITNAAGGSIAGQAYGVDLSAGGTLTNAGTVIGKTGTAVYFGGTNSNLLVLDAGYGLSGIAAGGTSATNTLELASAASTGTLSRLGTEFVDFAQTTIDADASWILNGANTIEAGTTLTELSGATLTVSGTLVNDGTIVLDQGTLIVGGLTGIGLVTVHAGSTLEAQGTVAGGETLMLAGTLEFQTTSAANVTFNGTGGVLDLHDPTSYTGTIFGFAPEDTILLSSNTFSSTGTAQLLIGNTLQIVESGTTLDLRLDPAQNFAGESLRLSSDPTTGDTDVTVSAPLAPAIMLAPVAGGNVVNAAVALAGFAISGTTSNVETGQTATIAIHNAANAVVDSYTASVNSGVWSVNVTPAQAQALVDGGYTVTADVTNKAGTAALEASESVTVNLAGIVAATPVLNTTTVAFGAARVGSASVVRTISIADGLSATPDQAGLSYALGGLPASLSGDATASGTLASGVSATVDLVMTTGTAGAFTNTEVPVALTSLAPAGSGLTNAALTPGTLAVSGEVYAPAVAQLAAAVNFGVVHVGDTVTRSLTITNAASGALTDVLTGGFGTITGPFTGTGSLGTGVTAGASGSLALGLNTALSGVFSASAALSLASHDANVADITAAAGPVTLTATIDNYAVAALEKVTGGGTLSQDGTAYTLNLGSVAQGAVAPSVTLGALNAATGVVDVLSGAFLVSGSSAFANAGLGSFSGLGAGQADTAPVVTLSTSAPGTFSESITLNPTGSNASGYSAALAAETLTIIGTVTASQIGYMLSAGQDTIVGSGNDTILASTNTLSQGDSIDGGPGTNALQLSGGGVFDLTQPSTLTNIQAITAQEGQGSSAQTVTLRAGLDATVNVASDTSGDTSPTITIIGASNSDVINLGNGNDSVTLGAGETVNGGGGNNVFSVTAATSSSTVNGGTGVNTLAVTNGGAVTMGSTIKGISTVTLGSTTTFQANATANLQIAGSSAGGDTISLGAASQTVTFGGANELIQATADNAGAQVSGLGTNSTLEITSGGTVTLNRATNVTTVGLDAASMLRLNGMAFINAIGSGAVDTIVAGGIDQTLTGGGGADTLIGYSGGLDTFRDTNSGLNGDTIQNFLATDMIDVTNLNFRKPKLTVAASGSNTVVTAASGRTKVVFTMSGSFSTTGFHLASDGLSGTLITHS